MFVEQEWTIYDDIKGAPLWMVPATHELGVQEIVGPGDNPRIVQYLECCDYLPPEMLHDATPWCSAFACWCMEQSFFHSPQSAAALAWRNWGVELKEPKYGAVMVFRDPERGPQAGHVAFFTRYAGTGKRIIECLGGNQQNRVCVDAFSNDNLLTIRWPNQ